MPNENNKNTSETNLPANAENGSNTNRSNPGGKGSNKKGKKPYRKGGKGGKNPKLPKQDPFFYAEDERTIKEIASIAWNEILGAKLVSNNPTSDDTIPGFMAVPYYPGNASYFSGIPGDAASLDKAAQQYYNSICQGVSGGYTDFDAPDIMMLSIAAADLVSKMAHMKRIFGVLSFYNGSNAYIPSTILTGLGVRPETVTGKGYSFSDFAADYNLRAKQINEIVRVPSNFRISKRWNFINSYIFSDNTNTGKSTLMAYVPAGNLEYDGFSDTQGTSLKFIEYAQNVTADGCSITPVDIQRWWIRIDDQIRSLTGQDQRYMFQAVEKVFPRSDMLTIQPLDISFESLPIRHDMVAIQLHNAITFPCVYPGFDKTRETHFADGYSYTWMRQIEGTIMSEQMALGIKTNDVQDAFAHTEDDYVLDSFDSALDAGQSLDATVHLTTMNASIAYKLSADDAAIAGVYYLVEPRSEILMSPVIYVYEDGLLKAKPIHQAVLRSHAMGSVADMQYSHINSAPYRLVVDMVYDGTSIDTGRLFGYFGEIDEYTKLDPNLIRRINQKCLYYMYLLPAATKSITK